MLSEAVRDDVELKKRLDIFLSRVNAENRLADVEICDIFPRYNVIKQRKEKQSQNNRTTSINNK